MSLDLVVKETVLKKQNYIKSNYLITAIIYTHSILILTFNLTDTWSTHEDSILSSVAINKKDDLTWVAIASLLLVRTAKQCRERWHNHLNFGLKKVSVS